MASQHSPFPSSPWPSAPPRRKSSNNCKVLTFTNTLAYGLKNNTCNVLFQHVHHCSITANSTVSWHQNLPLWLFCLLLFTGSGDVEGGTENSRKQGNSPLIQELWGRGERPLTKGIWSGAKGLPVRARAEHTQEHFVPSLISLDPHSFPPKTLPQALVSWAAAAYFPPSVKSTFSMSATHSVTPRIPAPAPHHHKSTRTGTFSAPPYSQHSPGGRQRCGHHTLELGAMQGSYAEMRPKQDGGQKGLFFTFSYYGQSQLYGFLDITSLIEHHALQTISV